MSPLEEVFRHVYYLFEETRNVVFMHIILSDSKAEAASVVVTALLDRISGHPSSVIGLATGKTMEPVYKEWTRLAQEKKIDHSHAFFFLLDEYLGLPENHPSSFKQYIYERFIVPLNLRTDQFAFPPVHIEPISLAGQNYEKTLKEHGGGDIQLLGIGTNGHIGFNEPGATATSRTRKVQLSAETRQVNRVNFKGEVPSDALSMGIGTILESKSLLLLATGKSKAEAIKYLLNHHDDPNCPATYLKSHPHFTLVLDPDAASKINLKI